MTTYHQIIAIFSNPPVLVPCQQQTGTEDFPIENTVRMVPDKHPIRPEDAGGWTLKVVG